MQRHTSLSHQQSKSRSSLLSWIYWLPTTLPSYWSCSSAILLKVSNSFSTCAYSICTKTCSIYSLLKSRPSWASSPYHGLSRYSMGSQVTIFAFLDRREGHIYCSIRSSAVFPWLQSCYLVSDLANTSSRYAFSFPSTRWPTMTRSPMPWPFRPPNSIFLTDASGLTASAMLYKDLARSLARSWPYLSREDLILAHSIALASTWLCN